MVEDIAPERAATLMQAGATLVDIREAAERADGIIPGARHAPLSALDRVDLEADAHRPVIFHCRTGRRTAANAEQLERKAGVDEVYILAGGLDAWREAGLPVERPS